MAGLLDALFPASDGGLLDFLKRNVASSDSNGLALSPDMTPANFNAAQGPNVTPSPVIPPSQWQSPNSIDNAQYPVGPAGSPMQANAQAVPQNPPPVIPASMPQNGSPQQPGPLSSFFNRAAAGLHSISQGGSLYGAMNGQYDDPVSQQAQSTNLTARALVAKGVSPQIAIAAVQPGNTEMLKTLIDSTFKPQTPMNLGNGYILRPGSQKAERMFTPDDKTPSGFTQDDKGNLHFMPGGPADPAYQRLLSAQSADPNATFVLGKGGEIYKKNGDGSVTIVHKNDSTQDAPMLTSDGVDLAANRIINGEKGVTTGFSRSKADMAAIYNRVSEIAKARGIDASDILSNINNEFSAASAARSFGGMTAKMETYAAQTAKAIDIAEQASKDVPRTNYPPINKAILAYRNNTGDPQVAALGQAIETLTQEYARAVGGGHGTVADKEEAREYLSKAQSHDQLVARLNVMRNEIARARESVGESAAGVGQIYRNNIRGASKLSEPLITANKPVKIDGYTITEH